MIASHSNDLPLPLHKHTDALDHFERHVLGISTLDALNTASEFQVAQYDLELLEDICDQSSDLLSFYRLYTLQILIVAKQSCRNEEALLRLIRSCLLISRYSDALELIRDLIPAHRESVALQVEALYRLGCWRDILSLYLASVHSQLTRVTVFQIARASLELGEFALAEGLISQLRVLEDPNSRNIKLLSLLYEFRSGQASEKSVNSLLQLAHHLTSQEAACFLRFMNQAELLLSRKDIHEVFYPVLSSMWSRLAQHKQLLGPKSILRSYSTETDLSRIAIVLRGNSSYEIAAASELARQISSQDTSLTVSIIALSRPTSSLPIDSCPLTVIESLPVWGILEFLRDKQYNVLIDMVSVSDPRWLLVIAQRVAAVQILWSGTSINFLPNTAPYEGQIADRWSSPNDPPSAIVPWLSLPCVKHIYATLECKSKHESAVPNSPSLKRSLVVLGGPHQLLPGASQLLKECLDRTWFDSLTFLSNQWSSEESIQSWWKYWLGSNILPSIRILESLPLRDYQNTSYIAADLGIDTPVDCIFQCIDREVPIVGFATEGASSMNSLSVLSSLGLECLVRTVPEEWLSVVEVLATDSSTYDLISTSIKESLPNSLLMNYSEFASHLMEAIRLASSRQSTR